MFVNTAYRSELLEKDLASCRQEKKAYEEECEKLSYENEKLKEKNAELQEFFNFWNNQNLSCISATNLKKINVNLIKEIRPLKEENEKLKEENEEYEMIRVGLCIELDKLKEVQGYIIEANNEESKKLKAENETLKEELNDANKLIEHLDQDKD
tara:strand:- start:39 stop:500 length:462 start_codon:yes stop_codon:yes gene_type:complete